jgi:hypothetical protein
MSLESTNQKMLCSDEELKILFPNEIQREIFVKIINTILQEIVQRTISIPFVTLTEYFVKQDEKE